MEKTLGFLFYFWENSKRDKYPHELLGVLFSLWGNCHTCNPNAYRGTDLYLLKNDLSNQQQQQTTNYNYYNTMMATMAGNKHGIHTLTSAKLVFFKTILVTTLTLFFMPERKRLAPSGELLSCWVGSLLRCCCCRCFGRVLCLAICWVHFGWVHTYVSLSQVH